MWSAFGAVVVSNTRVSHTAFAMSRGDLVVCSSTLGGNTESAMNHSLLRQLGSSSTAS